MLLSKDRLASLKEQKDYLEQLYAFTHDQHAIRLGKLGVPNDNVESEAIIETDLEFAEAGLHTTMKRLDLEIKFLTDYMS